MQITHIHSFLVRPEKGSATPSGISGAQVPLDGKLFTMLSTIFDRAETESNSEIIFNSDENGGQNNLCKNLIVQHAKLHDLPTGRAIAERLQSCTDNRSGLGLLFLLVGTNEEDGKRKIVVSRFPADVGVLADENSATLTVEFLERVFMKSHRFYKSVLYSGDPDGDEFWTGRALDRQMVGGARMADYWLKDFLLSDMATQGARGSTRVGEALKQAFNAATEEDVKDEIIAAVRLSSALDGGVFDSQELVGRLNLSEKTQDAVLGKIRRHSIAEKFVLNTEILKTTVAFKSVGLDTGVRLTADAAKFQELIREERGDNGISTFTTSGMVISERIRNSNT